MTNYTNMWNFIQQQVTTQAQSLYNVDYPELALVAAIVVQAAKDRDFKYFKSDNFYYHCKLLRINFVQMGHIIKHAYLIEDSGEKFSIEGFYGSDDYLYDETDN